MQSLLGGGNQTLIGLDISSSSVKLLELAKKGDKFQVETYAIEQLPPNAVNDKQITDPKAVGEVIARVVNRAGSRAKHAAVAVAGASVITKIVQMPGNLSENDMEEQIKAEADQYIPYPIDEVNLDFQILGQSEKTGDTVDVLLAACRKEQIEQRCAAVEIAGLKPVVVDIESNAARLAAGRLIESLPNKGVDAMVALFEVGALTTSMQVIRNEEVLYDRDQAFGGAQLTQLIVRQYGFSAEEAESKKRNGDLPEDYQSAVLRPFVESLAQEIGRALQFFFTSTPHNRVDHIMLAGGSAPLPGLTEAVTQQTGFACSTINPFDGMEIGDTVRLKKMAREAPSYLTSCGLAMRRFLQ